VAKDRRPAARLSLKSGGVFPLLFTCLFGGPATGFAKDISQADLITIGNSALRFSKADDFSHSFDDTATLGRTFRLTIPFKRNEIPSMPDRNEGWTYDSDSQQLTLAVVGHGWMTTHRPDPSLHLSFSVLEGFEISNVIAHRGRRREQNAFGAQVDVNYGDMTSVGVAAITPDTIAKSVKFDRDWNAIVSRISIGPDDARKKMAHAIVVVEGSIAPLENGHAILCDNDGTAATFDSPTTVSERFCVFNAVVTRVKIESGGEVLAEWK